MTNLIATFRSFANAQNKSFLPHSLDFKAQSLNAVYGCTHRCMCGSHKTQKDTAWAERRILMLKLSVVGPKYPELLGTWWWITLVFVSRRSMISSDDLSSGTLFRISDRPNGMGNATSHVQTTNRSLNRLLKFLHKKKNHTHIQTQKSLQTKSFWKLYMKTLMSQHEIFKYHFSPQPLATNSATFECVCS